MVTEVILIRCDCFNGDKCYKLIEMKLRLFCDALLYKETCIHILYKIIWGSIETHLREEAIIKHLSVLNEENFDLDRTLLSMKYGPPRTSPFQAYVKMYEVTLS